MVGRQVVRCARKQRTTLGGKEVPTGPGTRTLGVGAQRERLPVYHVSQANGMWA